MKNFYHLLEYDFHIPSFQRGYRWEKKQIENLLDDLKEFLDPTKGTSKFYCLQPIVVRKREDGDKSYDVLDGQQRLTTIYLILSYLEKTVMENITKTPKLFSLQFEMREKEEGDYLRNKRFKENNGEHEENIDFFYIHKAYTVIEEWFNNNLLSKSDIARLLAAPPLYGNDKEHKDVRVIWYEISSQEDAKEVFSNLNYGKIGLTETELVKALILQCDVYGDEKPYMSQWSLKVASDWDMIERELQEPTFWAMLSTDLQIKESENTLVSRIFFVLDLVAKYYLSEPVIEEKKKCYKYKYEMKNCPEQQGNKTSLNNPRYVYSVINQYLSGDGVDDLTTFKERVATLWGYILDAFSVLKEWYKDHKTYHKLGLLRLLDNSNNNLLFDLFTNYTQKGKKEFQLDIKKRIGDKVRIVSKYKDVNGEYKTNSLATINYRDNPDDIRKVLKLFNVQLMIESHQDGVRFDFAKFREQNVTSLEHIHPQHFDDYEDITGWVKDKKADLGDCKELLDDFKYFDSFTNEKYKNDRETCMEHIHHIDKRCDELAGMDENIMHSIKNMALIDKDTNSAMRNYLIYRKRNKLKERSKNGTYVPIGTWHAFNKFFSQEGTNLKYWTEPDRDAYYAAIEKIYNEYVN